MRSPTVRVRVGRWRCGGRVEHNEWTEGVEGSAQYAEPPHHGTMPRCFDDALASLARS